MANPKTRGDLIENKIQSSFKFLSLPEETRNNHKRLDSKVLWMNPDFENKITIEYVGKKILSNQYYDEREIIWDREKKKHVNNLWNGCVYTIEEYSINENGCVIVMGLCDYKDIIFKKICGYKYITETYGENHLIKHAFTTIVPITENKEYIFGLVGKASVRQYGMLAFIGGSLNQNEHSIKNFSDIKSITTHELHEEAKIKLNPSEINLFSLNTFDNAYHFVFYCHIDSNDLCKKSVFEDEEISQIIQLEYEDLIAYKKSTSKEVDFFRRYVSYFKNVS